jgi:hypothetical protein
MWSILFLSLIPTRLSSQSAMSCDKLFSVGSACMPTWHSGRGSAQALEGRQLLHRGPLQRLLDTPENFWVASGIAMPYRPQLSISTLVLAASQLASCLGTYGALYTLVCDATKLCSQVFGRRNFLCSCAACYL